MIPSKKLSSRKVKIRPFTPFLIVAACLLAAVGFSISVESRSSGWFRKDQPNTKQINAERTKNSRSNSVPMNSHSATGTSTTLVSPVAPTVTATKVDSLLTDGDNDGKADPGDTLKYTVVINATGADATAVQFTDTVDPNTTFVAGSVRTTPLARPDSYSAAGNIRISVAAPGVLANDSDADAVGGPITATAGTFSSAQGGNVTLNADGSFTYNPPAGFEGSDTFTYTLNDNDTPNQTDTGTVSITVSGMIWFIDNNFVGTSDGRLTNPFKTLAAFQAINIGGGNNAKDNQSIFIYESASAYNGSLTLRNGQKLIGQDATDTLSNISGITPPAGSDALPATNSGNATIVTITSAATAITLGLNNTVRGYTGGDAVTDISGSAFGTLNITDVTLNGNGQALNLTNGTLSGPVSSTATFGSISSTNSATTGVSLDTVAGILSSGSTTVTNPTGIGISVNSSSGTLGFANTSVSGSGGTGISLTSNSGAITFGSLGISPDANQRALLATENSGTITATSGVISNSGATAVEITRTSSTTPLNVTFTSVTSSGGTADGIRLSNTSGSFSVIGDGTNTSLGGNSTGGTISGKSGADGSTTSGIGIFLNNVTNITLRRMTINGTNQNFGIYGSSVNGMTLEYATVGGTEGDSTGGDEGSIIFGALPSSAVNGLIGTSTFTNVAVSGSIEDNFRIRNSSGTSNVTITGSTFTNAPNDNLIIEPSSTANVNAHVTNNTFTGAGGDHFQASTTNSATSTVVFTGNLYSNGFGGSLGGGVTISGGNLGSSEQVNFNISNNGTALNPLVGSVQGGAININEGQGGGTWQGQVSNNIIGNPLVANSGAAQSSGIRVENHSTSGTLTAIINGNTIRQWNNGAAINTQAGDAGNASNTGVLNVTVTNNTSTNPGTLSQHGFVANIGAGSGSGTAANVACVDARTNTLDGNVANGGAGVRTRHREVSTVMIPGYTGTQYNTAAVATLLQTNNPASVGPATAATSSAGPGYTNTPGPGNPCPQPTVPSGPITSGLTTKSDSLQASSAASAADKGDDILFAVSGENTAKSLSTSGSLTPSEASAMLQAAIARWADAGLSNGNLAKLQSLSVEVADLPDGQLATANSSKITLDETAAGYGWFFDTTPSNDNEFDVPVQDKELQTTDTSAANGRIDLLTVLLRELGSQISRGKSSLKGQQAWLMQSTLGTGTRRAPSFKHEVGQVNPTPTNGSKQARVATTQQSSQRESYQLASANPSRNARGLRNHAMRAPTSFSDVNLSIGDIPAGHSITITFNAQVKDPFPGPGAQVCNQGSVTGSNFATVLTDDPDVGGATDPTCTNIDLQADLEITAKTDAPDPVIAGNNITYTINFQNNGPNASGATITDATPAGTTFVSASVTTGTGWGAPTTPAVGGTGNVVFSKASVASGESAVFQIVVKVNSSVAGGSTITNTATAATSGGPTDPDLTNNSKTATTAVIAQADLSITKTDGATTEIPGTSISYTIVVSNAGPSDANGVSVADTFPGTLTGVTFTSLAAGGATGNTAAGAGNISDTVNMPVGSSITYTVNATIQSSATGSLSNTATVTAPGGVTDPTPGNNSATDTDTLTPQADLSITKTDGVTSKAPGTSVTYTIVVSNSGPSDAPGTTVADTFPSDLTGVSFTSVAAGGATGNTAAGSGNISDTLSLPSGSSVTYTVNATIKSSATGSLSNTATVTAGAGVTDPTPGNNSATDTDTLTPQADLSITKTDGVASKIPGTSVTYTIVVTNTGPSDAPGTTVGDTFPATLTGVSYTSVASGGATGNTAGPASGNISDTLSMPSGSTVTYTVNATVQASATGSLSNTATVTAGAGVTDPTPGNNSATDTDTLTPSADVSVTKTDSPDPVVVGNNITYTITVTNNGPSDAQTLSLSDVVPTNTTLVSVTTPAGWSRTDLVPPGGTGTLTFTRATLAPSVSSIFTVVVNVNAGTANGTTITNTANVSSTTTDPTPGNNSATATTQVQSNADLAISKTRTPNTSSIDAGSNVTYTVQAVNNGPAAASSVTLTDVVPAGTSLVSQSNPVGWTCNTIPVGGNGTITCTKASMANAETATLTVVVTINCNVANGATINNTATIGAVSPPDNNSTNNSSSTSFTVNNPAVTVVASVAISQLPQNSHDLINVGLAAAASGGTTNCPPGPLTVQVFGDEDDQTPTAPGEVFSPDAKDIAVSTLRLRGERVNTGNGRVYLIVVRSGTSFATVTVVVAKSSSPANVNAVNAEAAAAKAYADSHAGAAPVGYFVIGDGPIIGNKQ